jgi:hypothetical protein
MFRWLFLLLCFLVATVFSAVYRSVTFVGDPDHPHNVKEIRLLRFEDEPASCLGWLIVADDLVSASQTSGSLRKSFQKKKITGRLRQLTDEEQREVREFIANPDELHVCQPSDAFAFLSGVKTLTPELLQPLFHDLLEIITLADEDAFGGDNEGDDEGDDESDNEGDNDESENDDNVARRARSRQRGIAISTTDAIKQVVDPQTTKKNRDIRYTLLRRRSKALWLSLHRANRRDVPDDYTSPLPREASSDVFVFNVPPVRTAPESADEEGLRSWYGSLGVEILPFALDPDLIAGLQLMFGEHLEYLTNVVETVVAVLCLLF